MDAPNISCPAADPLGDWDDGCVCRIAHEPLRWAENPKSIFLWCRGTYEACPTWRKWKEAEWERRDQGMLDEVRAEV